MKLHKRLEESLLAGKKADEKKRSRTVGPIQKGKIIFYNWGKTASQRLHTI